MFIFKFFVTLSFFDRRASFSLFLAFIISKHFKTAQKMRFFTNRTTILYFLRTLFRLQVIENCVHFERSSVSLADSPNMRICLKDKSSFHRLKCPTNP